MHEVISKDARHDPGARSLYVVFLSLVGVGHNVEGGIDDRRQIQFYGRGPSANQEVVKQGGVSRVARHEPIVHRQLLDLAQHGAQLHLAFAVHHGDCVSDRFDWYNLLYRLGALSKYGHPYLHEQLGCIGLPIMTGHVSYSTAGTIGWDTGRCAR